MLKSKYLLLMPVILLLCTRPAWAYQSVDMAQADAEEAAQKLNSCMMKEVSKHHYKPTDIYDAKSGEHVQQWQDERGYPFGDFLHDKCGQSYKEFCYFNFGIVVHTYVVEPNSCLKVAEEHLLHIIKRKK